MDEYNLYMLDGTHIDEDELLKENFVLEAELVLATSAVDLKAPIKVSARCASELKIKDHDDDISGKWCINQQQSRAMVYILESSVFTRKVDIIYYTRLSASLIGVIYMYYS